MHEKQRKLLHEIMTAASEIREDLGDDVSELDLEEMVSYKTRYQIKPETVAYAAMLAAYNANTKKELASAIQFWTID